MSTNGGAELVSEQMAVTCRMKIMLPTWLPAVREAWTSAEKVDFDDVSYLSSRAVFSP